MRKPIRIKKNNVFYRTFYPIKKTIETKILNSQKNTLFFLLAVVLVLYITIKFDRIFFIVFLTLAGALSMIHIRYVPELYVLGIEFCTLATVLTAKVYGRGIGAAVGFVSILSATIISGRFKHTYFISILTLPIIGLIVPFFHLEITILGVIMSILYDLIILPLYVLTGSRIPSSIIFFISHTLFNYWAFSTIGPVLIRIMS